MEGMTGKVVDLHTENWRVELAQIYDELRSGKRRNVIIISEMPEDKDDDEGDLQITMLGIGPCRYAVALIFEAATVLQQESWEEE